MINQRQPSLTQTTLDSTDIAEKKVKWSRGSQNDQRHPSLTGAALDGTDIAEEKVKLSECGQNDQRLPSLTGTALDGTDIAEEKVKWSRGSQNDQRLPSLTGTTLDSTDIAEEKMKWSVLDGTDIAEEKVKWSSGGQNDQRLPSLTGTALSTAEEDAGSSEAESLSLPKHKHYIMLTFLHVPFTTLNMPGAGQNRVYLYTVYDHAFGDFPAKNNVTYTVHLNFKWFWPTLNMSTTSICFSTKSAVLQG